MKINWNYPTSVWVGENRIKDLPEACKNLRISSPLFVTDKDIINLGMTKKIILEIKKKFSKLTIFSNFSGNPFGENVEEGVLEFKKNNCDGVIAFGGGSSLDVGKAIAFMSGQTRPIWDFEDIGDYWKRADEKKIAPIIDYGNCNYLDAQNDNSSSMLLSPRTVENILTMANDDARNGNRASLRDLRDAKRGVTPKINDIATDRALIFKADRHVMPLQRHSLHGATTDCYYAPSGKRQSIKKHFAKSKEIFPRGKMIYTKTTVNAQHHWVHNLNRKKYDLKQIASKPGRGRAPAYASKWLNNMVPVNMELRELPVLTPQTQHFCANVDMPFNPFLQYEHQAYLRAERKRLKQEKLEWEEYEYQMRKQDVEEYKYRIYEEPKIEREAERRRQEQELKKLQAMQKKADEGFKFKKKKRKRKGKRGSDTQQTPQTTEYGNGALAATV